MRTWFILCSLALWLVAAVGYADTVTELIEQFPTGHINWTQGVVVAKGSGSGSLEVNPHFRDKLPDDALQRAISNIRATLAQLRMDGRTCVADLMANKARIRNELFSMVSAAEIVQTEHRTDGGVDVTVKMALHGGFAQFMLPEEIRQVEPIKPLNGNDTHDSGLVLEADISADDPEAFTGLIVDARGIGAQPAMVPVLYDENGQEVYSPAFMSREFAVQYGVCQYRRFEGDVAVASRVAPKPLVVKGLRTREKANSEIVISNADAAKLRSSSAHLGFLKQCRVIIMMD